MKKKGCAKKKLTKNSFMRWIGTVVFVVLLSTTIFAQDKLVGENEVLRPKRTDTPPVIDGVLDDAAWSNGPIVNAPFILNSPVYGDVQQQKTEVWLTYDSKNIYIAFLCVDDPQQIIGTMTKRDNILNEDWVGVDLDTMGTRQTTYEHAINPMGIQADLINSVSGGESLDPDWVWYSAGKITKEGYIVEIRLPLKSLKYKSGKLVTMNLAFYRKVSHSSTNASWPQMNQKKGYFNSLNRVIFENLPNQLRLEALPAVTFSSIRDRQSPQSWGKTDNSWQAGLDLKYGMNSSSNIELSINPDFSQVESDQFQILANQRYPIFYNEKRPFFMEIANQFSLAGANGNGNMSSAVHTRTIVDPAWGVKYTGEFAKVSVGLLAAGDEWPGRAWQYGDNPHLNKNANSVIGRAKYLIGGDAYVGFLYSGREFAGEYNRAIAADAHFRFKGKHNFSLNTIYTFSQELDTKTKRDGGALTLNYDYNQKPLDMNVIVEDYGRDFRMDSAFYQRTGISSITGFVAPRFYPQWKGLAWVKRISIIFMGNYLHDKFTGKNDSTLLGEFRVDTPLQGTMEFDYQRKTEFWAGQNFTQHQLGFLISAQPFKWLNAHVNINQGDGIYYNSQLPYLGKKFDFHTCVILQLGSQLMQHFSFTYQDFHRAADKSHVYDLSILVSRTTFQFNKHLFIRGLVQLDTYSKKILSDLLASFTLIPGTVMHVGYGSLHEKMGWENKGWQRNLLGSEYQQMRQSFFCKVSYRWQF